MSNWDKYKEYFQDYQKQWVEDHRLEINLYRRFISHIKSGFLTEQGVYVEDEYTPNGSKVARKIKKLNKAELDYCLERHNRRGQIGRPKLGEK